MQVRHPSQSGRRLGVRLLARSMEALNTMPSISALHSRLRTATKASHHALDHHPLLAPLLTGDLSVLQYGDALAALHGIYAQAEEWIIAFLDQAPGLFDYRSRQKLPALESDLARLGRAAGLSRMAYAVPHSVGALIGVLYTIEGSMRGGQFIARALQQIHGENLPTRFFKGYGDCSSQYWQAFLEFADANCSVDEYGLATTTAVSLFEAVEHHLDQAYGRRLR